MQHHSHRLSAKAFSASALPCLLVFILAFVVLWPAVLQPQHPSSTNAAPATTAQQDPALVFAGVYRQANLVSDVPGVAFVEDRLLRRPWGVALDSQSDFWVVNHESDTATVYEQPPGFPLAPNPAFSPISILNVPTLLPAPALPTGGVANTTPDFHVARPGMELDRAEFIFVTLNGGINAWRFAFGSTAEVVKFNSGRKYTGVTIGSNASGNLLFVADFQNGHIDVFDKDFNATSVSGNFTDATVPANFHPYNIQKLGGSLYVTYAEFSHVANDDGFVRKFDMNGVRDLAFAINNGPVEDPWGMAIAPANFGAFSNLLLVGNSHTRGSHEPSISAFNPATGVLAGNMVDESGAAIQIQKLRGLVFGNGINGGYTDRLYFAGGVPNEQFDDEHGLFGSLQAANGLPTTLIKFSSTDYNTTENAGHFDVTVTRTGDLSGTATVNYETTDSSAVQKSEYEIALGKLTFSPGEASKTFRVLIVDDNLLEAGTIHDLNLVLSNPTGAALVAPSAAKLFIMDNEFDSQPQPVNIVDATQFFVRQQYFDFLNREPDTAGFDFWVNQITSCGNDQACIELKRINVSAAFFLSIEFQGTGMPAYLTERAASGALPRYGPFMRDVQALQKGYVHGAPGASAVLEANKRAFFDEFVTRPEFMATYDHLSNREYLARLMTNGGVSTSTGRLFLAELRGSKVVPPATTPATGLAIALIQPDVQKVSFYLAFDGLTSAQTSAHLHGPAEANANGPELFTLPNGEFQDHILTLVGPVALALRDGKMYIDIHTQNNPNGEIRGNFPNQRFFIDALERGLNEGVITRAQALRLIAEDPDYRQGQLNRAFVLMEYFGYLRRNPNDAPDNDLGGYNFWLAKLNQFNGNFVSADMVKAFIKSTEYRSRFGPP
jgi:uncharacterized protein (TIGR03118 family)